MTDLGSLTRSDVESFLYYEARLLDQRDYEEWFELYTKDAVYWLPMGEDETPGLGPSVLYDDHHFLARRVYRLLHTRVFSQRPPSRTVHLVSNVELGGITAPEGRSELTVYSSQVVHEVRAGGTQQYGLGDLRTLAGRCEHRLAVVDGDIKITLKKFELIDRDSPVESLAFVV